MAPSAPARQGLRCPRRRCCCSRTVRPCALIGTPLATEYARVRDAFGYDDTDLAGLAHAGVDASFAPDATKTRLHHEINTWLTP